MRLKIGERLIIERFIPREATYAEAVASIEIRNKVRMSPEEEQAQGVQRDGRTVSWKNPDYEVDIPLTQEELDVIQKGIDRLDRESKIEVNPMVLDLIKKVRSTKGEKK